MLVAGSKNHLQVYQHASSSPRPREDVIAAPTNISLPVPLSAPHFDRECVLEAVGGGEQEPSVGILTCIPHRLGHVKK